MGLVGRVRHHGPVLLGEPVCLPHTNRGVVLPFGGGAPRFTADGGATWSASAGWTSDSGLDSPSIASVAAGPSGILVAAGANGRLARSIDGGRNWSRVDTTAVASTFHFTQVVFRGPALGLAVGRDFSGFDRTIYRTQDGGRSWVASLREYGNGFSNLVFSDDNTAWVGDSDGTLLRSTDAGLTWSRPIHPSGSAAYGTGVLAFSSRTTGLYLAWGGTLFRTTDGGDRWDPVPATPAWLNCSQQLTFVTTQLVFLSVCGELHRSADAGLTWQQVADAIIWRPGNAIESMTVAFATPDVGIAAGSFGSLQRTSDGGVTWRTLPMVPAVQSHMDSSRSVWFVSATEGYVVGAYVPTLRTIDGGASWTVDQGLRGGGLRSGAAVNGGGSVAVGQRGTVMRRTP